MNVYHLAELPTGVVHEVAKMGEPLSAIAHDRDILKWSGVNPPPAIGERVSINMNGLGKGVVTAYFHEAGWVGVEVLLDVNPAWRKRQGAPNSKPAMIFGAELHPSPFITQSSPVST